MDKFLEFLEEVNDHVDFKNCTTLIDDGILDSFDILDLVGELNEEYEIEISAVDIVPENFNSAEALWNLVTRLSDN